ncbi:MAG: KH domain-containing protein [Hyphomonadaceae bacterium]|nr:KH domain-containing protein [Clostridia bacterium]
MKELLEYIAKSLVNETDAVMVTEISRGEDALLLELRVAPEDMGKVIGKQGKIAKAIRTVVKASATIEKKKVTVDIVDQ